THVMSYYSPVLDPQYGMYVWPSAVVLAQYLWKHREELRSRTVLELGAGASLPGVVAARCGAKVILSDSDTKPLTLQNCRRSCDANGLTEVQVLGLTWGTSHRTCPKVRWNPPYFEDVLVTVAFLLQKNPKAQFWTTYQERRYNCFGPHGIVGYDVL
uniref:Methyltransferase like 23 n=1 Tax=Sphaeramia orbicularis TaxID=375764 RepID=A0A672Z010_9TELE